MKIHIFHDWTKWKDGKKQKDTYMVGYNQGWNPQYETKEYVRQSSRCKKCNKLRFREAYL